jgi:cbb3-type cytochrome oxidase cytochrome c subunit
MSFRNINRLHVWMAISSLALLAATVWMFVAERQRPVKIEQVYLPELTIDYHFAKVPRVDRCVTCHKGMDDAAGDATAVAFRSAKDRGLRGAKGDSVLPILNRPHPRLDLFVGADSPHPLAEFGCTICHDGQGSATEFHWASHSPNDPQQAADWRQQHGWSANPHWDLPMLPRRFAESRCLKCHLSPSELEPSRRFPDAPAAKLLAGYHLVRQYGCFGCHEIPGFAQRRVGPSLRDIADKVDARYLADRLADPSRFLPGTRMPRLFGLFEHLDDETAAETQQHEAAEMRAIVDYLRANSRPVDPPAAEKMKTVQSQEPPSAERGKRLFELRGCLACHKHADFPARPDVGRLSKSSLDPGRLETGPTGTQGPELSAMGAKYNGESGARWLVGWLRDPARYSPQTLMPNLLLSEATAGPVSSDPAADIAAYLLKDVGQVAKEPEYRQVGNLPHNASDAGRRAIARRGCAGCHDIAGFENPQPIGPTLSDWGRKPESLLAFENVDEAIGNRTYDTFYRDALKSHRREGFLWQKLLAPRSFDYEKARGKPYEEQLRMGRFHLTDQQREAIATFVLGLVADPPTEKYVYRPRPRQKAIIEGRQVLDKYACDECHTLEMERWKFAGTELVGMPRIDAHGRLQEDEDADGNPAWFFTPWEPAEIDGRKYPVGGPDVIVPKAKKGDSPHLPERPEGCFAQMGTVPFFRRPPRGGGLARLLYPAVIREARAAGAAAVEVEAWGWVPPVLAYEGAAIRPAWLHEYLLRPRTIRPAAVLHMPQFNMSSEEAGKIVDYFAAVAGETNGGRGKGDSPIFATMPRTVPAKIGTVPVNAAADMPRLDNAFKLVLDRTTFCAKCHAVGDYSPGGLWTALAPNLDETGRRIRPEYVRRWLADPRSVLPYTAMPAQFPPAGPPLGQDLFPATSREQLDAVADLLLHYDQYWQRRNSVRRMMETKGSGFGVQGSGRK